VIFLAKGTLTWAVTNDDNNTIATQETYDFTVDGSIPAFVAESEDELSCSITTGSLGTLANNPGAAVIKYEDTLTGSNTSAVEFSFDGGKHFITVNQKEVTKALHTGSDLRVRFTITRQNNTDISTIDDYGVYHSG
jgi:hypothetical protein